MWWFVCALRVVRVSVALFCRFCERVGRVWWWCTCKLVRCLVACCVASTFPESVATTSAATTEFTVGVRRRSRLAASHAQGSKDLDGEEWMASDRTWTGLAPGKDDRKTIQGQQVAEDTCTVHLSGIEFACTRETKYISYIIKGSEKTALIDSSQKKFEVQYIEVLESLLDGDVDLATLDYIVVSHAGTNPDHSGLLEHLVQEAQEGGNDMLTIVGSMVCITSLQQLVYSKFKSQVVKSGDQIDLGGGHVLEFVLSPNRRLRDTTFTYDNKTKLLYGYDVEGIFAVNRLADGEFSEIQEHFNSWDQNL